LSLEDIKAVAESEKKAADIRNQALIDAKQLISDAERRGKEYDAKARAEAEAKVKDLLSEAQAEADRRKALDKAEAEKRCEDLEALADSRLDKAAAKIVERIVNA